MKKSLTSTTTYEPNPGVKVKVVNKPTFNEDGTKIGFDASVTLTVKASKLDELKFSSDDEIADFFGAVDFTDPQQGLGI